MADDMKIEQDGARYYIPLSHRWEVQTKGNGSSFRIAERREDGHRMLVPESPYLHDFIEQMAREVNADHAAALAQIEGLKADVAKWREHENAAVERGRRYQIELAAAKRDAERVDWLESPQGVVWGIRWITRALGDDGWTELVHGNEYATLREAIDAARTPSTAQGGEKP